jgi:hypothetical protein
LEDTRDQLATQAVKDIQDQQDIQDQLATQAVRDILAQLDILAVKDILDQLDILAVKDILAVQVPDILVVVPPASWPLLQSWAQCMLTPQATVTPA